MHVVMWLLFGVTTKLAQSQEIQPPPTLEPTPAAEADSKAEKTSADVLSADEWNQLDLAMNRALQFLASQQQPDGSFPTSINGQPAVTSLCALAFMAHGHLPGEGPYGHHLDRATEFVLACQKPNGIVMLNGPTSARMTRAVHHDLGQVAVYNHAISSLSLSETYGMSRSMRSAKVQKAIEKSLDVTLAMQRWRKDLPIDHGGWRYLDDYDENDSDLSITGWQLMFLRSARNAGFDVPKEAIDDAVGYVRRTLDKSLGSFRYTTKPGSDHSRGMAGAGILALGHAGFHNSFEAQRSGQWLLQYDFDTYNSDGGIERDRYHYSLFNCCQGMYQIGGLYWEKFFPRTVRVVLDNQRSDGSWEAERYQYDRPYGNSYTTALVVLALGAPNELLPIFQR